MKYPLFFSLTCLALVLSSCNAGRFYNETFYGGPQSLQLGVAQREIYEGMGQDEVAIALGSPNIVTYDKESKETWIYDKISTEVRRSGSSGLILFCQTGADYVTRSDVSQKTLTIVIKFDDQKRVQSLSYHSSKF